MLLAFKLGLVNLLPHLDVAIESSPNQISFLDLAMAIAYRSWLFLLLELVKHPLTAGVELLSIFC